MLITVESVMAIERIIKLFSTSIKALNFFFLGFYLFIHERHTERSRDIGRGRSRLSMGSPMQDSIPGLWDHDLSGRQKLNH